MNFGGEGVLEQATVFALIVGLLSAVSSAVGFRERLKAKGAWRAILTACGSTAACFAATFVVAALLGAWWSGHPHDATPAAAPAKPQAWFLVTAGQGEDDDGVVLAGPFTRQSLCVASNETRAGTTRDDSASCEQRDADTQVDRAAAQAGTGVSSANDPDAGGATFHGYTCTLDCSGHEAGYAWAQEHSISDPDDCPIDPHNSHSFTEGCWAFAGREGP